MNKIVKKKQYVNSIYLNVNRHTAIFIEIWDLINNFMSRLVELKVALG